MKKAMMRTIYEHKVNKEKKVSVRITVPELRVINIKRYSFSITKRNRKSIISDKAVYFHSMKTSLIKVKSNNIANVKLRTIRNHKQSSVIPYNKEKKKSSIIDRQRIVIKKGMNNKEFINKYQNVLSYQEIKTIQEFTEDKIYYYYPNYHTRSQSQTNHPNVNQFCFNRAKSCINNYTKYKLKRINNTKLKSKSHLNYRFEILNTIDRGTFGTCLKCIDHKTSKAVCVKILSQATPYSLCMNEIRLLKLIASKDKDNESNIYKYTCHFIFQEHICIVTELLSDNLYRCLSTRRLSINTIKSYAINILFSLLFLKSNNIIHCDIKPENILQSQNQNQVKLIDLGTSCFAGKKTNHGYIQSRYYRAPEVVFGFNYSFQIDMWSLACVLCELYRGRPIFECEDERDLIYAIMEYLDVPPREFIINSRRNRNFFDRKGLPFDKENSRGMLRTIKSKKVNWFLKGADSYFIDFIKRCLKWIPFERMTPENALMHQWIIKDMNSECLFIHKRKIKRIKHAWSKQFQIAKEKCSISDNIYKL